MADIKLSREEAALWSDGSSRGEHFRRATRDRADEQARVSGRMCGILDPEGKMLHMSMGPYTRGASQPS